MSVLTRATRRNTPEDGILHSHSRENLRSYKEEKRIKKEANDKKFMKQNYNKNIRRKQEQIETI
jgi:hypothetical protein